MPKFIDMTNQIINGITVIEQAPKKNNRIMWKCKCHCGNIFIVNGTDLRNGHTKSCGCLKGKNKISITFIVSLPFQKEYGLVL